MTAKVVLNQFKSSLVTLIIQKRSSHPSEWTFCGYNEIQKPRKKNALIAYQRLTELTGFESYTAFQKAHKKLVNETLANGNNFRQTQWTESIAVGSKGFIETIKEKLGKLAKGRKILENDGGFHLKENMGTYNTNSDIKKVNTVLKNTSYWDINL